MMVYWDCFADAQESRIQVPKGSNIGSADMKGLRFSNTQELHFQAWNLLYMGRVVLQGGRFADVQKLRFETAKR